MDVICPYCEHPNRIEITDYREDYCESDVMCRDCERQFVVQLRIHYYFNIRKSDTEKEKQT